MASKKKEKTVEESSFLDIPDTVEYKPTKKKQIPKSPGSRQIGDD